MNRIVPFFNRVALGGVEFVDLPRIGKVQSLMIDTPANCGRVMIGDGANVLFDLPLRLMKAHWPPLDMDMERYNNPQMRITGMPKGIEYTVYVVYSMYRVG